MPAHELRVGCHRTIVSGNFVSKKRQFYDDLGFGQLGARGLLTGTHEFIGTSTTPLEQVSNVPGDPRAGVNDVVTTSFVYDAFGNVTHARDGLFGTEPGHERGFSYDGTFHTYVVEERIATGGPGGVLTTRAEYDTGEAG